VTQIATRFSGSEGIYKWEFEVGGPLLEYEIGRTCMSYSDRRVKRA